jgi:hypothetical protein
LKVLPRETAVQVTLPPHTPTNRELLSVTGPPPPVVTIELDVPSKTLSVMTDSPLVLLSNPRPDTVPMPRTFMFFAYK